jgi:hypothetical protein
MESAAVILGLPGGVLKEGGAGSKKNLSLSIDMLS